MLFVNAIKFNTFSLISCKKNKTTIKNIFVLNKHLKSIKAQIVLNINLIVKHYIFPFSYIYKQKKHNKRAHKI